MDPEEYQVAVTEKEGSELVGFELNKELKGAEYELNKAEGECELVEEWMDQKLHLRRPLAYPWCSSLPRRGCKRVGRPNAQNHSKKSHFFQVTYGRGESNPVISMYRPQTRGGNVSR